MNLAKQIIQTNIDVWGESFLIKAFILSFAIGVVLTLNFDFNLYDIRHWNDELNDYQK